MSAHVLLNLLNELGERDIIFPNICKPLVVYRFYCMALYYSQTRRHVINEFNISWSYSLL